MKNDNFLQSAFSLHSDALQPFKNNNSCLTWETISKRFSSKHFSSSCGGTPLQPQNDKIILVGKDL